MGYFLKKLLSSFMMPVPALCILLLAGYFMLFSKRRARRGRRLLGLGLALLLLSGLGALNLPLLTLLENSYPPFHAPEFQAEWGDLFGPNDPAYVVVLGAGHISDPTIPITSRISTPGMMRLAEGIAIYHKLPYAKLLTSGGAGADPNPDGKVMAEVAIELGVPPEDILLETRAKDTAAQAKAIAQMVGHEPTLILVTSAAHMPRSMALFRKQGLNPIAAPTHYLLQYTNGKPTAHIDTFFPSGKELDHLEAAIHEFIGIAWSRLHGDL